ncbi:MAG: radical SAM protein [Candidatus Schekmanbacteria bacterium]|nr:radical SAM protein [Candidatus Schekmanbacteria bacterium]
MLLIHPPVAKPCEPPSGIARLSGALYAHGIKHTILDANLEALIYNIDNARHLTSGQYDKWTARALRNLSANHEALKNLRTYQNIDRYKRGVIDLNHAIEQMGKNGATPGISNYSHEYLSPVKSDDLLLSAKRPEENPYYPYFSKRLPALIEKSDSKFAGFSLNYLSQALCTFAMIGFLKQRFPDLSIILGGGLVTSWMRNPRWKNPFAGLVAHIVAGPGEEKLINILGVNDFKEGYYKPDYSLLPLDDYLSPGRILPYSASSGCYWHKCSFCPEKAEGNSYMPVPADTAIDDINELSLKTKPVLIHMLDNAISESMLKKMAQNSSGINWYGFARITPLLADIDFCIALKKSGCVMLKLGIESGDQNVLDKMNKGIDIETASLALKTLKRAGVATYVYLIFGTPAEALPSARKTLEFVVNHKNEIGFLNVAIFNMPVCSAQTLQFETRSFYEGDLSLYTDFTHPEGWNRKDVRLFIENEFKRQNAVSEILKKDPPVFTSNHASFFI